MTYDPTQPTDKDKARARLEDTDSASELFTDQDYLVELAHHTDWRLGTAVLARRLATRAIEDPTSYSATGDFSAGWIDRSKRWFELADRLEAEVAADQAANPVATAPAYSPHIEPIEWR